MITEAWLPMALAGRITARALRKSALYELLSLEGVALDRIDNELTAELASPATARLLDVPLSSALIRVNRLAYADGQPHHFLTVILTPTRSRVLISHGTSDPQGAVTIAHDIRGQ